jgi:hypothetical protein
MANLRRQLDLAEIKEKAERMKAIAEEREAEKIVQLPLWQAEKRGTPNSFIRSALFAAIQSKDRAFMKEQVLASQAGITVKFTGEQLNQEDLTVWDALVHLARQHPLGQECEFTAYGILKAMGLPTGGAQHKKLHSAIVRLTACAVEITHEKRTYFGSLIENGIKDEMTSHYQVKLNRDLIRLFGDTQWTGIDWQQRLLLSKKPLAQALHAYFSSHQHPHPVTLSFLRDLTGSRNAQAADFKRKVKSALDSLVKISFLRSYQIEGDLVTVERVHKSLPTLPKSQKRDILLH